MVDQTPPPQNQLSADGFFHGNAVQGATNLPNCQQAAQQILNEQQLAAQSAGQSYIITPDQLQQIQAYRQQVITGKTQSEQPTFSGVLNGGASGSMTYDPNQTVGMRRFDPEGTRSIVQIPQAIVNAYYAGPGNPFYEAADATIRGYTNNPRTAGPQGGTGNIQDTVTGLWSRNPVNAPVAYGPTRGWGDFVAQVDAAAKLRAGYTPSAEGITPQATETLRQQAEAGHNTSLENYYANVLSQWAENKVERASEYHYLGQATGIPVPANRYEYQGDLAVEFLKGTPQRATEAFSPVSGVMGLYLPAGQGIQQHQWDLALNYDKPGKYAAPTAVSFAPAITFLQNAQGQYGPYGTLFGGPAYQGTPSSSGIRIQVDTGYTAQAYQNVMNALSTSAKERGDVPVVQSPAAYADAAAKALDTLHQQSKEAAPVMVKAPDGTMQPDWAVPWGNTSAVGGRLKGGNMVAGIATETGDMGLPLPFRSSVDVPQKQGIDYIGTIISKGPLTMFGAYGWLGTAVFDYISPQKVPAGQEYKQRNDIAATILEGGVEAGDVLFKPLGFVGINIHPGQDLLIAYGQNGSSATEKYNTNLAAWQSQGVANDELGTKIAGERGSLEGMLKGKVNAQGQFTGNDMDFMQVQSQTALINKDVATYNEYGTKGQSILTEGFQSGSLIPTGNGGYVVNPDKERTYGAFSDWSNSAQKLITGASPGQFVAYEQTPEFKNSNLAWAATEGIFKAATNPERAMSTVIQGAELYVGFSAVGGGFAALAPEAEVAPVGLTQHIGAIGSGVLQSNILTYGLLGAFGTGSVLHDTNNFKNTPQQSASNLGGTFVDYTVMFGSGAGLESSPHGVDYLSTRFAEKPMTIENAVFRLDVVQRPDVQVPSGVGGSLSYTEYHEIATQPSINILGHEIAFPRIFSPVDRPEMAWSRPVELGKGDVGSLLNARLSGTEAEPLVSSRVENIRMESFRSQDLAHVTGDVRIGEVRLPHTINDYLKMGAADAKIMGVSQEEAAASLMSDAAKVTQPTTGYRLLDTYVEKGTSIREAVDWSTDLQGGTSHELNRINLEDYFGSMSVTQTGSNVYRMTVTRDMQGSAGGQYDVTGARTPEAKIVSQLQEFSRNMRPDDVEHMFGYDQRGNLLYEGLGTRGEVPQNVVDEATARVGTSSGSTGYYGHSHPTDSWLEILRSGMPIREKIGYALTGKSVLQNPSAGDIFHYAEHPDTVIGEYIASPNGVAKISPTGSEGWQALAPIKQAVTGFLGLPVEGAVPIDAINGGDINAEFIGRNQRYSGSGYTERVTDASLEMRNAFPEGVRNQFVDMVDRMTLKNPNLEFVREPITTTTETRGGNTRGGIGGPSYASPMAQQMSSPVKPLYDYAFGNRESVTKERSTSGKERVTVGVPQDTKIPSMLPVAETGRGAFIPAVVSGKQSVFAQENVRAFSTIGVVSQASEQKQRSGIDFIKAFEMGSDVRRSLDTKSDMDTVNAFIMGSSLASLNNQETRQDQNPIFAQFTPQNQKQNQPQKQQQEQPQIQQQKQTQFQQQPGPTPPPLVPPPQVPVPKIVIPGLPWGGGGGGSGGSPIGRGRRKREIFTYEPINVRGLLGMPKMKQPRRKK
jgi:hypothetical protein